MICFLGRPADDPSTTVNSSSIGLMLSWADRWEGLQRCIGQVAVCGGMGSICISVWDPDSSGFSLHPDLLHACLTVYCHPASRSSLSTHLSFQQDHTHIHDTHKCKYTHTQTQNLRVKVIIS